jgi:hypothetical protein
MTRERKQAADEAGVGPDPRQSRHLTPLKELSRFRLMKGEPDVRGWTVYTSNGREVGTVDDLLVDPTIGEAVLLDIDLMGSDRRTVAPLRAAWIDRETKRVILDGAQLTPDTELPTLGRTSPAEEEARRLEEHRDWRAEERAREEGRGGEVGAGMTPAAIPASTSLGSGEGSVAVPAPPPPGSEVVVERRIVSADEPSWGSDRMRERPHDAGLPPEARTPNGGRRLVEEVVVRRRYMDAAELAALQQRAAPPAPDTTPEAQI